MELGTATIVKDKRKSVEFLNAIIKIYGDEDENFIQTKQSGDPRAEYAELVWKAEGLLKRSAHSGDKQATFLLGQLYYEEGLYEAAEQAFNSIKDTDPRALYQLAVMYFDGLRLTSELTTAVEYMKRVADWQAPEAVSLKHSALYNLATAYLGGYGVQPSSAEAERYLLLAADDGNPKASVEAQTSLGIFYSSPDTLDYKKAFFWHSEACGNGSLESQGALGVMYLYGLGVAPDPQSALHCLKEASDRGNVYAQGHLAAYYYHRKLYCRAVGLCERVSKYEGDVAVVARSTGCLPEYVGKGVAMALFYYACCLHAGKGAQRNVEAAQLYFTKASRLDPKLCKDLQLDVTFEGM